MRRLLLSAVVLAPLAGCHDYDLLQQGFCASATKKVCDAKGENCERVPVELCDDFTGTSVDAARWTVQMTGAAAANVLDPSSAEAGSPRNAYRGDSALRLTVPAGASAQLVESSVTPQLAGSFALRMFVHLQGFVPPGSVPLVSLRDGAGAPVYELALDEGRLRITDIANGRSQQAASALNALDWQCVELAGGSRVGGGLTVTVGTPAVATLHNVTPAAALGSTVLGLSRGDDGVASSAKVWFDEVILSDRAVGCRE